MHSQIYLRKQRHQEVLQTNYLSKVKVLFYVMSIFFGIIIMETLLYATFYIVAG